MVASNSVPKELMIFEGWYNLVKNNIKIPNNSDFIGCGWCNSGCSGCGGCGTGGGGCSGCNGCNSCE